MSIINTSPNRNQDFRGISRSEMKARVRNVRVERELLAMPGNATARSVPMTSRSWITTTVVILVLFAASAIASAFRKPITEGFDEVAHISYVAYLQTDGPKWPRFPEMRMIDPVTFQFDAEQNYLNHPPFYYGLVAALGPDVVQQPASLTVHRLLNVGLVAMGLVALLVLARRMKLEQTEFYAFAIMIAVNPVLASLAGSINNDNLSLFGGALALLGLHAYVASSSRKWLLVACCGLLAASAAKLTGLLLVGTTLAVVVALLAVRRKFCKVDTAIVAIALAVAAAPYVWFIVEYGSAAPNTPAQSAMLTGGATTAGWAEAPRMGLAAYALFFLKSFLMDWMPVLKPRGLFHLALLALPAAIILVSIAGWIASIRALLNGAAQPADFIVIAGIAALVSTLAIHIAFSHARHLETGWMMDAYPRYYLPLIAIVPMAALAGSSAIPNIRLRKALVSFLVVAPIIFGLFGSPIG
jgi:hypothetical protein